MRIPATLSIILLAAATCSLVSSEAGSTVQPPVVAAASDETASTATKPVNTQPNALKLSKILTAIQTHDGIGDVSESIELPGTMKHVSVHAGPGDTLRISFTAHLGPASAPVDSEDASPVRIHQAFVVFEHIGTGAKSTRVFKSLTNGKHKFDLKLREDDHFFRMHPGTHTVHLILGHPSVTAAIHQSLIPSLTIKYPILTPEEISKHSLKHVKDYTVSADDFAPRSPIEHAFRVEATPPPFTITLIFTILVIALPYSLLIVLWARLGVNVRSLFTVPGQLTSGLAFFSTLMAYVGLFAWYWLMGQIIPMVAWMAALGVVSAVTGRSALSGIAHARVQSSKKD